MRNDLREQPLTGKGREALDRETFRWVQFPRCQPGPSPTTERARMLERLSTPAPFRDLLLSLARNAYDQAQYPALA